MTPYLTSLCCATMNALIIINILNVAFFRTSYAFTNGFPKEQCDEMDPTKINIENSAGKGSADADYNSTDFGQEDALPTSIQLSGSLNLYRIVTSSPKYRRGRTLDITIRGPEFNAFMLQVRKIGSDERRGFDQPVRVGEFVSWPPSLQPVMCDKNQPTAITNKNYSPKSGITIKWKAPNEDVGDIHVVARFVAGDEYWHLTESREIPLNEFPVNLKNCGKAKSCILYSEKSSSCHEDNCDYILTYNVVNNTNVEFVLGGTAKGDQNYLAVGFSMTPEAERMKLIACTRAKTVAEIKFFNLNSMDEGLMEHPMHLENKKMDLDGDRMWCSFIAPMVTQTDDGNGLDLSVPLYQIYMRGNTNYTKSSNLPILPSKLLISKKEISVDKIKLQYHTMEKPKESSASTVQKAFHGIYLMILLLHFQQLAKRIL
ncbi:ferric-chelate reductase 1-like [Stegodyphus dumicola]|uniref:ferric-chelate reductase 1-like n=1 Tax=Stegodyphus dumicola TaxID=202533 RepID=UPI0015AE7193|nr:ferric-chelate reductase 1-like [Stegodyphus dumicola]